MAADPACVEAPEAMLYGFLEVLMNYGDASKIDDEAVFGQTPLGLSKVYLNVTPKKSLPTVQKLHFHVDISSTVI